MRSSHSITKKLESKSEQQNQQKWHSPECLETTYLKLTQENEGPHSISGYYRSEYLEAMGIDAANAPHFRYDLDSRTTEYISEPTSSAVLIEETAHTKTGKDTIEHTSPSASPLSKEASFERIYLNENESSFSPFPLFQYISPVGVTLRIVQNNAIREIFTEDANGTVKTLCKYKKIVLDQNRWIKPEMLTDVWKSFRIDLPSDQNLFKNSGHTICMLVDTEHPQLKGNQSAINFARAFCSISIAIIKKEMEKDNIIFKELKNGAVTCFERSGKVSPESASISTKQLIPLPKMQQLLQRLLDKELLDPKTATQVICANQKALGQEIKVPEWKVNPPLECMMREKKLKNILEILQTHEYQLNGSFIKKVIDDKIYSTSAYNIIKKIQAYFKNSHSALSLSAANTEYEKLVRFIVNELQGKTTMDKLESEEKAPSFLSEIRKKGERDKTTINLYINVLTILDVKRNQPDEVSEHKKSLGSY